MFSSRFIELFYLFFEGIMIFQVMFFGMIYFLSRRKDVLYYSLLNLFGAAYFFLNAPDTFLGIDENIVFDSPLYLYVNFAIFLAMIFSYLLFLAQIFNDSINQNILVKRIYTVTFYAIPVLYLLFVIFAMLGWKTNVIFYTAHLINGPFSMIILMKNFRQTGYRKLIIYGMLVIFVCVNLTIAFTIRYNSGSKATILDKYPLATIKVGMLIDILLFQLALLSRWNEQEKQLALEKLQSQLEVEKLRNKISAELHDDIGSTLSGVSMYTHMAVSQLENGSGAFVKKSLEIIQKSTEELIERLRTLVWTVKAGSNRLEDVIGKLESYGNNMCMARGASFTVHNTVNGGSILSYEKNYVVFLCMKEAINNAVKYSGASAVTFSVSRLNGKVEFKLSDNGSGFDIKTVKAGNGLRNMQERAGDAGAVLSVYSKEGQGSEIKLHFEIPQ